MEQNNHQQQFQCSGDCLQCHPNQRQYCAAQFTYNSMRMIEVMQEKMDVLTAKVEALQGNDVTLFKPTQKDDLLPKSISESSEEENAQGGDGAEE